MVTDAVTDAATTRPRILVTNDDGIDSIGLHVLARALRELGEVVVAAPNTEYSGASAAFGALHLMKPEIHRVTVEGLDDCWSVTGPPALCVMFSRFGAFGAPFDLVVAGINPGANVGRAVYHSGTVGAALTARNGGTTGIAVSQDVTVGSVEGQAWDSMVANMRWESAATVAVEVVRGVLAAPPAEAALINVNVPNLPVEQLKGWRHTSLALLPGRAFTGVTLEPMIGYEHAFYVQPAWGEPIDLPIESDAGAVQAGEVSITWLGRLNPVPPDREAGVIAAVTELLGSPQES